MKRQRFKFKLLAFFLFALYEDTGRSNRGCEGRECHACGDHPRNYGI